MMKKILTLFLALAASVGTLFAQSGTCGDNLKWTLSNGTLTISGTGAMTNYTNSSSKPNTPWYSYSSSIKTVQIGSSVTSIGACAFYGCSSLTALTIPNSVTSIGTYAFYNCSGLTSVTIGESVTSIGYSAFSGCSSLTSVTIPNSVTSIGSEAFGSCSSLISVKIGESVTSIGGSAFSGCSRVTSITIPNSVTSIDTCAFYNCSGLTSVTIGESVTSIGDYAFKGCSKLATVIWNAKKCNDFSSSNTPFYYYGSSSSSDNFDLRKQITSFTFGDKVEYIPAYLCAGMSNLTSITIPNSVTSIGTGAFSGCGSLTSVTINSNSITSSSNLRNVFGEQVKQYTVGDDVTSIGNNAFYRCSGLTSVTIGESVTSIGDYAFYQCSKLTSVTIPNSVTSIGNGAFESCSSLTSVTIPNSVTSIGNSAFGYCSSLTSVTIPNSVTSIGDYAFYSCSSLTSVTIPNSVTSIGSYAFPANAVQEIHFTGTMEEWFTKSFNPNRISSSYTLFINGEPITNLVIPNSVTSIGEDAFWDCSSLKNVSIASSVKVLEGSAFYNCSNIETITCYGMRPPTVNTNALYGLSYSTIVYVPADYLETYQMHEQWGLYDVRALENSGTEPATYTITWQDEDGNVIKTDEVKQGTTPAFTGTTPTKPATNEYTYEFAGWLPKIKAATEDAKYTTFFERNKIETPVYTVNINGENCSLNINNQYPEGTVITLEAVADECFEFQQWSDGNKDNPRTITITANTNLTAEFNKVRYTVTGEPSTGGKVQIRKQ